MIRQLQGIEYCLPFNFNKQLDRNLLLFSFNAHRAGITSNGYTWEWLHKHNMPSPTLHLISFGNRAVSPKGELFVT